MKKDNLFNQLRLDEGSGLLFLTSAYGTGYIENKDKSVTLLWGVYNPEKRDEYTIDLSSSELSLLDLNYSSIAACTSNYGEIKAAIESLLSIVREKRGKRSFVLERLNGNKEEKISIEIKTYFFAL